ncbi:MAG: hypothetical protein ABFD16_21705, partial [Thermoguttaceae bacterium]
MRRELRWFAERAVAISAKTSGIGLTSRLGVQHRRVLCETLEDRRLLSIGPYPELPGLELVDPRPGQFDGQIVYLDFDGAEGVDYNGPVVVKDINVPAFKAPGALAGHEQEIIADIVSQLDATFAGAGVDFTASKPATGTQYSTIYIGGDDSAFEQYGSFLGLVEQVDIGNADRTDVAFVFSDTLLTELSLAHEEFSRRGLYSLIEHEISHCLGYAHDLGSSQASNSALSSVASAIVTPNIVFNLAGYGQASGYADIVDLDKAFLFTPDESGTATFAATYPTNLSLKLYRGDTLVASGGKNLSASVTAGTEYTIVLDMPVGSWGSYSIAISLPGITRYSVPLDSHGDAVMTGYNISPSTDQDYFEYIAPASGSVTVKADSLDAMTGFDTDLFIYSSSNSLKYQDTGWDNDGDYTFSTSAGETWYFVVRSDISDYGSDSTGAYTLYVTGPEELYADLRPTGNSVTTPTGKDYLGIGDTITLATQVSNTGDTSASAGYVYYYYNIGAYSYDLGDKYSSDSYGSISSGYASPESGTATVSSSWDSGTYYFSLYVDATDTTDEGDNEDNNRANIGTVKVDADPPSAPSGLSMSQGDSGPFHDGITSSRTVAFDWYDVSDTGGSGRKGYYVSTSDSTPDENDLFTTNNKYPWEFTSDQSGTFYVCAVD